MDTIIAGNIVTFNPALFPNEDNSVEMLVLEVYTANWNNKDECYAVPVRDLSLTFPGRLTLSISDLIKVRSSL